MDITRRSVLQAAAFVAAQSALDPVSPSSPQKDGSSMRFIATWKFGKPVNDAAVKVLERTGSLIDAIEQGIWVAEADAENSSVGLGGIPNAQGIVQLDACIMWGPTHQAGAVAALEGILHPISVARRVMEQTSHVMLVGDGARQFALQQGFKPTELLTPERKREWEVWKQRQQQKQGHDTITVLGLSDRGELGGGCSTSGLGYKLPGRVGDSPIIGSGLYVDNEVGAAGSTGMGEIMMRYCAAFMVVERMRGGAAPPEACWETVRYILQKEKIRSTPLSVNLIALNRAGEWGAAGTDRKFCAAVAGPSESGIHPAQILEK